LMKIYILMSLLTGFVFADPIEGDNRKILPLSYLNQEILPE